MLSNDRNTRPGLTLMELVVVLAILIALGALMIPMFPNILRRAHKATDATQTQETAKVLQLYQGLYVSYPDEFDSLTDGTKFPSYLPGGSTAPFGPFVTADKLTQPEVDALHRVGINNVHNLASDAFASANAPPTGDFRPTLNPYADTYANTKKAIGTADKFAILDTANIPANFLATVRGQNPTARFIVFGVGQRCSMIGKVMQKGLTSVPQDKDFTPDNKYCRVGVIFMISGEEVNSTERARFIAAVALEDDELELTEKDVVGYYSVAK